MPNDKKSNSPLTGKPLWVYVTAVLGVSAWMFFLGVLVGRGTAPIKFDIDKFQKILLKKRLEEDQKADQKEMPLAYVKSPKNDKPKKFQPQQPPVSRPVTGSITGPITGTDTLTTPPGSVNTETTTDPESGQGKTEKKDQIAQSIATGRLYTVQVASLRSKDSAEKIVKKLSQKGYDAFVSRSYGAEAGTWYRVRIGHFPERSQAQEMARKMERESYTPIVVRRK